MQGSVSVNSGSTHSAFLFVLLGASNLARGYYALTRYISQSVPQGYFINAMGPGRGYLARGGLLNLSYTPIVECKVLDSAEKHLCQGGKVACLFTDIGNDIMYGISEGALIECLDHMIDKALRWNASVVLTSIYVDVLRDLGETSFKLLKTLFFPNSPVTFDQAAAAVKKVNFYLEEKSRQNRQVHLVSGLGEFCGMDKIHFSLSKSHLAWSRVASEMLHTLNIVSVGTMNPGFMAISLCSNLNRLIGTDILRINKRCKGFY